MPAYISTSERTGPTLTPKLRLALAAFGLLLAATPALAADGAASGAGKTFQPEEDDFNTTPFTEYGEFNEDKEEEEDAKYFAHGRFFGVSAGLGFEGVGGNRGALWQGGFPLVDVKLHYWFDFNFALDLGLYFASHYFETTTDKGGHVDVNMVHVGVDVRYYFDTKNLASAISFANPFLTAGFGSYTQTQTSYVQSTTTPADTGIGLAFGAGLEFALKPKKSYLQFEGKYHMVTFKDTYSNLYESSNNVPDLTGGFFTLQANVLFTW